MMNNIQRESLDVSICHDDLQMLLELHKTDHEKWRELVDYRKEFFKSKEGEDEQKLYT
jgi:hypothetical protein